MTATQDGQNTICCVLSQNEGHIDYMTAEEWKRIFEELIIALPDDPELDDPCWKQIEDHCKLLKELE